MTDHLRIRVFSVKLRSAMAENPTLHANFTVVSSMEPELLPTELLHCGKSDFRAFCCCELDPMTFIYEHDPYHMKMYPQTKNDISTSRLWK